MKRLPILLLLLALAPLSRGQHMPRDLRIGPVLGMPTGDLYESATGLDIRYRFWKWETTSFSLVGALQQWDLSPSARFGREVSGFKGFNGSPACLQAGAGLDEQVALGDSINLNLRVDLRYSVGLSGTKLISEEDGVEYEQDVDVSDALVATAGAGLEVELHRDWTLFADASFQAGILPGEISNGERVFDNEPEALFLQLGILLEF